MPTVATKPPIKAAKSNLKITHFEEGQMMILPHRPKNPLNDSEFEAMIARTRSNPKGDIVKDLKAFRDNPRGE